MTISRARTEALKSRDDVLVFETEPLEADLEVSGPVSVSLFVSSSPASTSIPIAGEPCGLETGVEVATNRVHVDATHPSRVTLNTI